MRRLYLFFLAVFPYFCFLQASTVRVINDSPFPLGVTVLSATGVVMGRETLQPTQQYGWETFNVDVNKQSQTPYTVVFYCQNGNIFGTVSNVTTGSMVQASSATGSRYCSPKNDKKGKEEQKKSDLQYQPKPINPEQWRGQQRY